MPVRMLRERRSTDLLRVAPYIVLLGALGWSMLGYCQSPESSARLVAAGLDLFPSVLAADLDLENKTDAEGRLRLCLVYRDDVAVAERLAAKLREIDEIQGLPIQVHILDTKELKSMVNDPPAALFVVEPLRDMFVPLLEYSIAHRVLAFSPFAGDVAKGIVTGISVRDRILPSINMTTLRTTGLRLKRFFIKVSKQYD